MHRTSLKVSVLSIATLKIWLNQISVVDDVVQPPPPPPRQLGFLNSVWTSMAPIIICRPIYGMVLA